jgi:hypothetical protein
LETSAESFFVGIGGIFRVTFLHYAVAGAKQAKLLIAECRFDMGIVSEHNLFVG